MKKKATIVNQPDKTATSKSEMPVHQIHVHKPLFDHLFSDHSHGRVNKFPFGSANGPFAF